MPITEQGWEIHVQRLKEQARGNQTRTVGTYQVFHDGEPASAISVDGVAVPLFGTTAESKGPGQNDTPATVARPSRILRRYPLKTSGGPTYVTTGFRQDLRIKPQMPGIELRRTGNRSAIIIHPGKGEFLSSIGCINPCTSLPDEDEDIDYAGSRRRVIALIEDMKRFLGTVSENGDVAIINAFAIIDGEPMATDVSLAALSDGGTIDGRALAALHGVGVKSDAVKISSLHPAMAPVIIAVAEAVKALGLPKPVITSGNDSSHKHGSLHFKNRALDFRANNISIAKGKTLAAEVAKIVGKDYDVLLETFAEAANNHLHVEFDPD